MSPVAVEVSAGETEATAAVGALVSSSNVLDLAILNGPAHMRISRVMAVATTHRVLGRMCGKNRRDAFHVLLEAHVKVPLVANLE